nr:substrate-binding domain-containing protein [Acholeplasma laidlawii]
MKQADYHLPKQSGIATRELLSLDEKPTCIIYPDDYSFMGGMTEIEKHGLSIPNDISVVGYDGIYLSRILRPTLTTYVQNSEDIGKQAALKLINHIENPKEFISERITITGKLQKGHTVKDIKNTF